MSKKRILLDLRILAALVSMLARKHFLSNLHFPNSEMKMRVQLAAASNVAGYGSFRKCPKI